MSASFDIGAHFEALILRLVEDGRYPDPNAAVRMALRLLEEFEVEKEAARAEFRAKIDEGIADVDAGRTVPMGEVFAEIRREMDQRRSGRDAAE